MNTFACPNCRNELKALSNFCPNCGAALKLTVAGAPTITPGRFFLVIVVSVALFIFGWFTQAKLAGTKPEKAFTAQASSKHAEETHRGGDSSEYENEEIKAARKLAEEKPLDVSLQRQYASLLIGKIRELPAPPQTLVFETIETLRDILNLEPDDPMALIAMADISFDQQAFAKAIEFYKRYLEIEKSDSNAKARYASALSFVGQHKEALAVLEEVIKKDPKNFHARAYTAIAYAQMGDLNKAKEFGEQALELAPSPEAKERFSQFLKQVNIESSSPERGQPGEVQSGKPDASASAGQPESLTPVEDYIKNNPVAGPKFVKAEYNKLNHLTLTFQAFPMEAMPPFVKEKFINSIKESLMKDPRRPPAVYIKDLDVPDKLLAEIKIQ